MEGIVKVSNPKGILPPGPTPGENAKPLRIAAMFENSELNYPLIYDGFYEPGMTWRDWLNSEYNTEDYYNSSAAFIINEDEWIGITISGCLYPKSGDIGIGIAIDGRYESYHISGAFVYPGLSYDLVTIDTIIKTWEYEDYDDWLYCPVHPDYDNDPIALVVFMGS